jgi:hypothetical protein
MTEFALDYPARALPARARTGETRSSRPVSAGARPLAGIAGALGGAMGSTLSRAARRPVRTLVQCAALGIGGLIIINALGLQTARHPAPLGGTAPGQKGEMLVERPPLPPVRPSALAAAPAQPAAIPVTRDVAPPREAAPANRLPVAAAQPAARAGDPIGDLIRGEGGRSETPRGDATSAVAREPARPVLAAQRALVKLGYTQVKADGVPGEATKAAIERFERQRNLPVTGQLNARTMRELASASGMKLD